MIKTFNRSPTTRPVSKLNRGRVALTLAAALLTSLAASDSAYAVDATARATKIDFNKYAWGGYVVNLRSSRTYRHEFRLRGSSGVLIEREVAITYPGRTSYSRNFEDFSDVFVHGNQACTRYEIRHGTTPTSPLVANPLICSDSGARPAPSDEPLTDGTGPSQGETDPTQEETDPTQADDPTGAGE